jgi:membrane protein
MRERLARLMVRWPWLRNAVAVQHEVVDLNGGYAASAFTLIAFVSLFPLALVAISIIGLLSGSNPHLADDLVRNFGLSGQAATTMRRTLATAQHSGAAGSVIGLVGMAWTGLSLVGALQYVVNLPREVSVRGIKARLLGIPWLLGSAVVLAASIFISAEINWLPGWTAPLAILLSVAVDVALFLWTFWFLDARRPAPRTLLPGAIAAAVGFEVLKLIGALLVPRLVASSSATYGSIGVVFAILAWLLLFGRLLVYATVLNAVLTDEADTDRQLVDVPARTGSSLAPPGAQENTQYAAGTDESVGGAAQDAQ